jgi:hypothetical protein
MDFERVGASLFLKVVEKENVNSKFYGSQG